MGACIRQMEEIEQMEYEQNMPKLRAELIEDGEQSLKNVSMQNLIEQLNTLDQKLRDMIGDEIMYRPKEIKK